MERQPDLHLGLMMRIFGGLAVVFVTTLAIAPARDTFSEWREHQALYNTAAAAVGGSPVAPAIRQTWNPELGVVDRCTSCHLGMGPVDALPGHVLFDAHPEIPHDPELIGCTPCHAGQGRATETEAAHGRVPHWFEPLIPPQYLEAGCGTCHSAIQIGSLAQVDRGRALFERLDCLACHEVDGRGGARVAPEVTPNLSGIGLRGVPEGWHQRHLELRQQDPKGIIGESYGPLAANQVTTITAYLETLSGMPALSRGKRLFHERGCLGCHQVNGAGGAEGPELTGAGLKSEEDLVFPENFSGQESLASWHVEHLLAPAELVAGSLMPDQALSREEAESITLYLLSMRRRELPGASIPPDRARVEQLGEREFGTDGETLFLGFCAACHGAGGEGSGHGSVLAEAVPSVANPDFLALAPDAYIRSAIENGRPSRRMPGWSGASNGLRTNEIRNLVSWLRGGEPAPPALEEVIAAAADAALGARIYAEHCSTCHGTRGEGQIGPSLASTVLQDVASDRFLYDAITAGRPGTAMPRFRELDAGSLRSVLSHLRELAAGALAPVDLETLAVPAGDAERGGELWQASCASCHGADGEGGSGPAIGKPGFLRSASRAFVVESHARGRCRDAGGGRPLELSRSDLASVATWLAERADRGEDLAGRRISGDPANGERIYRRVCAGCHGADGEGKEAPALADAAFLSAANDGFLQATILRGRRGTAMPSFDRNQPEYPRLSAGEVNDTVSFIRAFADGKEQD